MTTHHTQDTVQKIVDVAAAGVSVGAIMEWVPAVAALFTILWTGLRIFLLIEERWFKKKAKDETES